MDENPISAMIKPYVAEIEADPSAAAKRVITWYEMYRACPGDPGARVVTEIYFKDWLAQR